MVHRQFSRVYLHDLHNGVFPKRGLQEKIAGICVVLKDFADCRVVELLASAGANALGIQCVRYGLGSHAIEEHGEDPLHNRCFIRHDYESTIVVSVSEHRTVPGAAFFEVFLDPPLLVFTD